MSTLNAAILIFLVLLCSPQIYSVTTNVMEKTIDQNHKYLLLGKDHVNGQTLLYALCGINGETAQCTIYLKSDVFDDTYAEYSCNATASSQLGKLQLLGLELWGASKALFVWRDIDTNTEGHGDLYIEALHMGNCSSNLNQFPIHIRPDKKRQEYIITSQFHYYVTFINQRECGDYRCKVTVDMYGRASHPQPWISGTNLIYTWESIEYSSKNLLINLAEDNPSTAHLYLINGDKSTPVNESKIAGGRDVQIKNATFMAMLQNANRILCNAVQISSHWLTATADCLLYIIQNKFQVFVKAGTAFTERPGDEYNVRRMVPHKQFNSKTFQNNIGLVQILGQGIVPNQYKAPIQLMDGPIQIGFTIGLFSYGSSTRGSQQARVLKNASTVVINKLTGPTYTEGTFCVSSEAVAACLGDAGGAAVYNNELAGFISTTAIFCLKNAAITITQISFFRKWIKSISGV